MPSSNSSSMIQFSLDLFKEENECLLFALIDSFENMVITISDSCGSLGEVFDLFQYVQPFISTLASNSCTIAFLQSLTKDNYINYGLTPIFDESFSTSTGLLLDRLLRKVLILYHSVLIKIYDLDILPERASDTCLDDPEAFPVCTTYSAYSPSILPNDFCVLFPLSDIMGLLTFAFEGNFSILSVIITARYKSLPAIIEQDKEDLAFILEESLAFFDSYSCTKAKSFLFQIYLHFKRIECILCSSPTLLLSHKVCGRLFLLLNCSSSFLDDSMLKNHVFALLTILATAWVNGTLDRHQIEVIEYFPTSEYPSKFSATVRPLLIPFGMTDKPDLKSFFDSFILSHEEALISWPFFINEPLLIDQISAVLPEKIFIDSQLELHELAVNMLKEVFPHIEGDKLVELLSKENWNIEATCQALYSEEQESLSSQLRDISLNQNEEIALTPKRKTEIYSLDHLGTTMDEILKNKVKVVIEEPKPSMLEENEGECYDSNDEDDEIFSAQLRREYMGNPVTFLRESRNTPERKALKSKLKLSDEQIEGWLKMNHSNLMQKASDELWDGQQRPIEAPPAIKQTIQKSQYKKHIQIKKKSHNQKEKATRKLMKSAGTHFQ